MVNRESFQHHHKVVSYENVTSKQVKMHPEYRLLFMLMHSTCKLENRLTVL